MQKTKKSLPSAFLAEKLAAQNFGRGIVSSADLCYNCAGDEYGSMPNLEWYNFAVVSSTINLKAGTNTIEFRGTNAAMNWDYIEMTTSVTELSMEVQDDIGGDIGGW